MKKQQPPKDKDKDPPKRIRKASLDKHEQEQLLHNLLEHPEALIHKEHQTRRSSLDKDKGSETPTTASASHTNDKPSATASHHHQGKRFSEMLLPVVHVIQPQVHSYGKSGPGNNAPGSSKAPTSKDKDHNNVIIGTAAHHLTDPSAPPAPVDHSKDKEHHHKIPFSSYNEPKPTTSSAVSGSTSVQSARPSPQLQRHHQDKANLTHFDHRNKALPKSTGRIPASSNISAHHGTTTTGTNTDIGFLFRGGEKIDFTQSEPATNTQLSPHRPSQHTKLNKIQSEGREMSVTLRNRGGRRRGVATEREIQPYGNIKHRNRRPRKMHSMVKVTISSTRDSHIPSTTQVSQILERERERLFSPPTVPYPKGHVDVESKYCPRLCNLGPCIFVREVSAFCQEYPNFYRLKPNHPDTCPRCQTGQFKPDWTPLSIFCCFCVPILGIPCCFAFREYACDHCGEIWELNDPKEEMDDLQ